MKRCQKPPINDIQFSCMSYECRLSLCSGMTIPLKFYWPLKIIRKFRWLAALSLSTSTIPNYHVRERMKTQFRTPPFFLLLTIRGGRRSPHPTYGNFLKFPAARHKLRSIIRDKSVQTMQAIVIYVITIVILSMETHDCDGQTHLLCSSSDRQLDRARTKINRIAHSAHGYHGSVPVRCVLHTYARVSCLHSAQPIIIWNFSARVLCASIVTIFGNEKYCSYTNIVRVYVCVCLWWMRNGNRIHIRAPRLVWNEWDTHTHMQRPLLTERTTNNLFFRPPSLCMGGNEHFETYMNRGLPAAAQ